LFFCKAKVDGLCCLLTRPCQKLEPAIPNDLLELDRSQLFDMELLSRGKYSEVFKGKFGQRVVAIKSMKRDYKNLLPDADKFLNEAKIMKDLLHENILRLYGVCSQQGPVLIVTEFIDNGCLLNYLRSKQGKDLKFQKLLDFAAQVIIIFRKENSIFVSIQIAKGMTYLEEKQCVHCNLAGKVY
jgi:serine/threonine protein kinase